MQSSTVTRTTYKHQFERFHFVLNFILLWQNDYLVPNDKNKVYCNSNNGNCSENAIYKINRRNHYKAAFKYKNESHSTIILIR